MSENVTISFETAKQILNYIVDTIAQYIEICGGNIDETNVEGLVYVCEAYSELDKAIRRRADDAD